MKGDTRLKLPGFGMPLNELQLPPESKYCMHALWEPVCFESAGLKLREVRMMEFMNQITDKPDWERKVLDKEIVNTWRDEAMGPGAQDIDPDLEDDYDVYMSEKMFDNCIKELRNKVKEYKDTGLISILDAEVEVVKSDSTITSSLADLLKATAKPLEDVPGHHKDWHPGSDHKVLDLLHPSLFPMVYGTSRVLPYGKVPLRGCAKFSGNGETYAFPKVMSGSSEEPSLLGSTQWLPSDVTWTPSGGTQITSYINNLHPDDHPKLYTVLEQFVAAAVPLWERCLYVCETSFPATTLTAKPRISQLPKGDEHDFYIPEDLVYDPPFQELENEDDYGWMEEEYLEWNAALRILDWPEPDDYDPSRARSAEKRPNLRAMFPDGLQVIFKLANIHLTPSNPEYEGGSPHVEGALNDRIVATALFYYDCDNITESALTLYHPVNSEELRMVPQQHEYESLERWLGISTEDPALQRLGRVTTREGRLIAFPNVLAHEVQPFKLADNSRPGHRKILAMFLVDPHIRVLSTSVVPPQRKDWWAREVRNIGPLGVLPTEIFDLIIGFVDGFPMSWEDALATRETLMQERSWAEDAFHVKTEVGVDTKVTGVITDNSRDSIVSKPAPGLDKNIRKCASTTTTVSVAVMKTRRPHPSHQLLVNNYEGPSHTKNVQFPRADWAATEEGKRLSTQIVDGQRDWEIHITYVRERGLAESFIEEAEQKRREAEAEYPNDISKVWQIKRGLVNALAREATREYAETINLDDYLEEFYLD
ncbi:hypothetical protein E0Z10_g3348 [Xylaria hypoxylon]|uniref:Duf1665 domain containing protein n=1 Tax=Xylaria hypoxylon TaxID=37992 RepID=A0A4Z0YM94_9PEZI|nr:hypothetical protein E0Z10_g3348 [Xylaria hypoxylon]